MPMLNDKEGLQIIKSLVTRIESGELELEETRHQAGVIDVTPDAAESREVAHTGEEFYMIWARRPGSYLNTLRRET